MRQYKKGDMVMFTGERVERAQMRTSLSPFGKSTTTDAYILANHDKEHTVKRVTGIAGGNSWEDSLMIELEGHYGGYNDSSLMHVMVIKNMLDEELFTI
jgi:hypothetical protein